MSTGKKIENAAETAKGKAKEAAGKATRDPALTAEGKAEQIKGDALQAKEKAKDAFKH